MDINTNNDKLNTNNDAKLHCEEETGTEKKSDAEASEDAAQIEPSDKKHRTSKGGFIKGLAAGAAAVLIAEAVILRLAGGGSEDINLFAFDKKLREIETLIDYTYLYDADKQRLEDGMFTGLVYGLTDDHYSAYYSKSVYDEEKKRLNGNYVGIGVTISKDPDTGGILVNAVNGEGPAARAGIQVGDIIIKADGNDLTEKDTDFAVSLITGEVGTTVNITLLRDGSELDFTVERENITTVSVQGDVIDEAEVKSMGDTDSKNSINGTDIGYISITNFNQTTKQEFVDELDDLAEDKQVDGIVIDLRNNGGGDMNICLEMLDMILPDDIKPVTEAALDETSSEENEAEEGTGGSAEDESNEEIKESSAAGKKQKNGRFSLGRSLAPDGSEAEKEGTLLLSVENKNGEADKYYAADNWDNDVPVVVVVNGNSASASEIFSGVLRDYGYQIVGEKTFGKGIVQSLYPLSDGSAVKFTTEQYRLPGGELIHGKGITPTIEVPFEEYDGVTADTVNYANGEAQPDITKDVQIQAAVKEIERQVYEAFQKQ